MDVKLADNNQIECRLQQPEAEEPLEKRSKIETELEAERQENSRLKQEVGLLELKLKCSEHEVENLKRNGELYMGVVKEVSEYGDIVLERSRKLEQIHAQSLFRIKSGFDNLIKTFRLLHGVTECSLQGNDTSTDDSN